MWHAAPAQAQLQLPSMGDGADLTTSEERRLGDRIIRSLYRDPDYIDDPPLHAYVMGIWQPLVQAANAARRFVAGAAASALPGRCCWAATRASTPLPCPAAIWVCTLGLIGAVTSRDELATVHGPRADATSPSATLPACLPKKKEHAPADCAVMVLGALAAPPEPGRGASADRWRAGGRHSKPVGLFARHGARGRPHGLQPAGASRVSTPRRREHVRKAAARQPPERQRQLALSCAATP